ncbi:DedA family protein [Sphingomonas carotinifaciens]|uniref:DedA family protein n=1 Tax=Sphingomonas carotinifaciens TaxID=1166323 RepID=A0A1G7KNG0_9SPHN|nr:DedA family protein [Sphingomonas carotinifaciens]MBB4085343.1 membrane protein DedA with SNARE-associated domain [Sphingomonas carotinifaciens]MWC43631.1 DedA family protein [Sphingomonas carotinifaciens]SDF38763.1 membrane protein DedA, SNARE-associated domain [Sphingomonas carotinifaciens]
MTDFILNLIAWGGYFGIFLLMALENIVPPVPSEVIMGLGGMAVARGDMTMIPLILWGTLGTTVGNYFWYYIGRHIGYERFRPFVDRHGRWLTMEWEDVERLHRFFVKHGQWVVFVFRFMPAFRTIISLPAGMTRMPLWRFLVWTFAGSTIWNAILAYAGLLLGSRFEVLDRYVGPAAVALTVMIVIGYVWRVVTWKPRAGR